MQTLKEGDKFERYQVVRVVGNGIAGVSYEAEDTRQNRKVILKLLRTTAPLLDAARRQFFREIQTISSIKHPQIAAILNYGEWHQQLFVVRTFTSHGSLLNNQGSATLHPPLDINLAITYGIQIAKVLNYIHKSGYAHGSLTFANILVEQRPTENQKTLPFLIADVGLAIFVQSQGYIPTSQLPITTAPEQLKGQTLPASDQYALATILYTLLAGRPPFSGSFEELGRLKNQETIQSIAPLNPQVSRELENVLRRALSAHPKNRYATIHEFIHAVAKAPKKQLNANPPEQVTEEKTQAEPESSSLTAQAQSEARSLPVAEQPSEPGSVPVASEFLPNVETQPKLEALSDTNMLSESESLPDAELLPAASASLPDAELLPAASASLPDAELPAASASLPDAELPAASASLPNVETQPELEAFSDTDNMLPDSEALPATEQPAEPASLPAAEQPSDVSATKDIEPAINARLVIKLHASTETITYQIILDETSIGRAGSSDVLLEKDEDISRHHALIRKENNQYVIYDSRSTDGVSVNGQKIPVETAHILTNSDQIGIGKYTLLFYDTLEVHSEAEQQAHVTF